MRRPGRRIAAGHLPTVGWLWLLWVMLWGSYSVPVVVSGLAVAAGVVVLFPLPPLTSRVKWRPLRVLLIIGHTVVDVLASAVAVGWEAVRHGPKTSAALIRVPLRADTDLTVTAVANLTTLTPGTLVLEIDRRERLLYVHALPVRDDQGVEHRRREVRAADGRVVAALGRGSATEGDTRHGRGRHGGGPNGRGRHGGEDDDR
ncbi:Na+/H+ antiporter subunit E [Streptomyces sp. TRM64462]|uniref:Na+/H+ antiporter subunit E n=1 Tax=Streptomyces sp. TRM64462 TaxID=2741726 RepID=UPI0015861572|nr:Na+/H+ antiporter subunit E [Streptomyces sp. TRM64462]